jgi:hypothetical protein
MAVIDCGRDRNGKSRKNYRAFQCVRGRDLPGAQTQFLRIAPLLFRREVIWDRGIDTFSSYNCQYACS